MVVVADEVFDVMASHVLYTDVCRSRTHAHNTKNLLRTRHQTRGWPTEPGRTAFRPMFAAGLTVDAMSDRSRHFG